MTTAAAPPRPTLPRLILGAFAATLVLFLWSGVTNMLPWGPPSAQVLLTEAEDANDPFRTGTRARVIDAGTLVGPNFDEAMSGRVSTLTTTGTFSWIVSRPLGYYDPAAYLAREAVTQALVAVLLTALAWITLSLGRAARLAVFGVAALAAAVASYGQLLNWWGLTAAYGFGAMANLLVGWLLAGVVLTLILRRPTRAHG